MTFRELLLAVEEKNLTKTQLEDFRGEMTHLHSKMQLELADVEKASALFYDAEKTANPDATDVSIKRKWKATKEGLREIELNRYIKTAIKELDNLKSRLYSIY